MMRIRVGAWRDDAAGSVRVVSGPAGRERPQRVLTLLCGIENCPEELAGAFCHLLLSHHGRHEWGAPVLPCLPEAYVLHLTDDLNAKGYHFRRAARESKGSLFEKAKGLDGRVYAGSRP